MGNLIEMKMRPSDVILDRVYNPAADDQLGKATPAQLAEACGIIPDFFCQACLMASPLTLENIADGMDDAYQYGGFSAYPFPGSITDFGIYQSDDGDDDMPPLVRFIFDGFECFVYQYAITAIRDRATRQTKIARFD